MPDFTIQNGKVCSPVILRSFIMTKVLSPFKFRNDSGTDQIDSTYVTRNRNKKKQKTKQNQEKKTETKPKSRKNLCFRFWGKFEP
jgi:hypothetical protein